MVRIYVNVGMTSEHNDMQALGLPDLVATSWLKNMSLVFLRGWWEFDVVHLSLLYFLFIHQLLLFLSVPFTLVFLI